LTWFFDQTLRQQVMLDEGQCKHHITIFDVQYALIYKGRYKSRRRDIKSNFLANSSANLVSSASVNALLRPDLECQFSQKISPEWFCSMKSALYRQRRQNSNILQPPIQ